MEWKPGDCYVRLFDGIRVIEDGKVTYKGPALVIFGEIEDSKYKDEVEMLRQRGRCFVRAYSVDCVDGELGTEYFENLIPISRERFEKAKASGWEMELETDEDLRS
jgi:hypothetical protein